MSEQPETCADASREAAALLAGFYAVCKLRAPTKREEIAAHNAASHLRNTGLFIPDWLGRDGKDA